MARIIDLGNGYARLEEYGSEYASLTFPLTISGVRRLYVEAYLTRDEFQQALLDIGLSEQEAAWFTTLDSVCLKEIARKYYGYRTV